MSICPTWVSSICLEIIWRHNDVYRADSLRHPLVIPCYDTWGFLKFNILISNFTTRLDAHLITNELHQAFSTVGFVYLKNHGIDREKVPKNFDLIHIFKKRKLNFDFNFRWIMCSKFHGISSNCPRTWNKITQEIRNNLTDTLEEIKKCRSLKFKIKKKKLILDIYFHADWKIAAFTKFVRLTMSHRPPVAIRTTEFRNSVWPSAN